MATYDPETVRRAVALVTEWHNWDHNLPIPDTAWGSELAFGIDVLLVAATEPGNEQ